MKTRRESFTSFEVSPKRSEAGYLLAMRFVCFFFAFMLILFIVLVYYLNDFSKVLPFVPILILSSALPIAAKGTGRTYFKITTDAIGLSFSSIKGMDGTIYKYETFDEVEVLKTFEMWQYHCRVLLKKKQGDGASTVVADRSFQTLMDSYEEAKLFQDIKGEMLFYGFEKSVITTPGKWVV